LSISKGKETPRRSQANQDPHPVCIYVCPHPIELELECEYLAPDADSQASRHIWYRYSSGSYHSTVLVVRSNRYSRDSMAHRPCPDNTSSYSPITQRQGQICLSVPTLRAMCKRTAIPPFYHLPFLEALGRRAHRQSPHNVDLPSQPGVQVQDRIYNTGEREERIPSTLLDCPLESGV